MKALVTALLVAAATFPAQAQESAPADATAQAKSHFRKGSELYREARYREAIAEFEEANRLRPHGIIFYNLAQCHERLGDIPAALRSYHEYLRAVPEAEDRASVNAALANLGTRLGASGVQQLLVYSDPEGAEVYVDGQPRGRTPFAGVFPHGSHRLSVSSPGHVTVTRDALLAADRSVEVNVSLAPAAAAALLPPSPARGGEQARRQAVLTAPDLTPASAGSALVLSKPAPPAPHRSIAPRWKWIAAGAAVVAIGAGAAYGLSARSASADLRGAEHDAATATRLAQDATGRARTANVLYGVGAAAGAAGLGILAWELAF